ncbi:DUF1801 domain-containing protein [Variovorax sp. PCZ-1]|uniref:iron chaperone n=1 Tax=Variovorax sp. PCZ-1 TaxID=2835533 RepID=UPI001BCC062F|nr:DUF1801 domain-containing protein [Variovorax sp. PCZ-1]MBS7807829.1 hypothetical protein [Variovorax sp. PCZ-1]
MPYETHEAYFAAQTPATRQLLLRIQKEIKTRVPQAQECISYNIPAFKLRRTFVYFAAFKKHIGMYPPITQDQALIQETADLRGPKGNLSFPYDQELPINLIGRVALALAAQYEAE